MRPETAARLPDSPNSRFDPLNRLAALLRRIPPRRSLARELQALERLRGVQQLLSIGSYVIDLRTGEATWSDELYKIMGVDPDTEPAGLETWRRHAHEDDVAMLNAVVEKGGPWSFLQRIVVAGDEIRMIDCRGQTEVDRRGWAVRLLGTCQDVTELRQDADVLAHLASHDPLTGLPNRTLFLDRLEHALARSSRSQSSVAVVFLDLDDFKRVNDTHGHEIGDRLLLAISSTLSATLRPGDTVARFGGDEFVVLCEDLVGEEDAVGIARRMADACGESVVIDRFEHHVTVSAGIAIVADGEVATASDLLREADAAMYRAKSLGKGDIEIFDEGMRERLLERTAVESALRRALERDELRLHFQPVMSLQDSRVVGAEALLRWQHPARGLLQASDFIAVAESSGLIVPIGEWVIEEACRQAAIWNAARDRGEEPVYVSVNLSPRQLMRSDITVTVLRSLDSSDLDSELLEIEITERALLEHGDSCADVLAELKAIGVRIAIDDFGTGYASLSDLRRLTIDRLKLDRSLARGLGHGTEEGAIVVAVLSMASALGVDVTAEGVETLAQLERLRAQGCGFGQGHLFWRPGPAWDLEPLLGSGEPLERARA